MSSSRSDGTAAGALPLPPTPGAGSSGTPLPANKTIYDPDAPLIHAAFLCVQECFEKGVLPTPDSEPDSDDLKQIAMAILYRILTMLYTPGTTVTKTFGRVFVNLRKERILDADTKNFFFRYVDVDYIKNSGCINVKEGCFLLDVNVDNKVDFKWFLPFIDYFF